MNETTNPRLIDRWFPIAAVDEACGTPTGSGRVEKAIFTWFASRPIAQARAAALTSLLPYDPAFKNLVESAIRNGDPSSIRTLAGKVLETYNGKAPVVLDMFSGRGIIPLEAARVGASAIGIDLSPVATLAGRLLADFPARDWSSEPALPFQTALQNERLDFQQTSDPRLARDVQTVLAEVEDRVAVRMERYYPRNRWGQFPWGYLWAVTMPCDACKRRFPLIGSLVLRHPYTEGSDRGNLWGFLYQVNRGEWKYWTVLPSTRRLTHPD
jgi:putative DNA methylase